MAARLFLLLSLGVLLDLHSTHGAVSWGIGECPNGAKPGDSWYIEGQCGKCDCREGSYSCYSCGAYAIDFDVNMCYHYRDSTKQYPECCNPIVRCRGDVGFNETLFQQFGGVTN
ncbi:unnamed protein product [Lymnaea stagnalis]|uniref:Uncharacterized protein n=1 Tax=Lymnaea stagnalis TaxID=6523 RepID=A0AAV2IM58_LYMST